MNVLIVGSGGREDALAWKLAQSPEVERVYCAPGNPGTARYGQNLPIRVDDFEGLAAAAKEIRAGLTVAGPEAPLVAGLADRFTREGLRVFGPCAAPAQLEGSKSFAKAFMQRHGIPTAAYAEFTDSGAAIAYIHEKGVPIVVKADGLAAGKGVTVAHTVEEAERAVHDAMVSRVFGDAGARVVLEECLVGEEASILALTDGETILPLLPSQDHKPALDGDKGPNTGGMGAYAPAPVVNEFLAEQITRTILEPCVRGMREEGNLYVGVLYAGLMIGPDGPKVVEFNCRFGDPEVQVVLPLLDSDLAPLLEACCTRSLQGKTVTWRPGACVTVVMASGGYPRDYPTGIPITGIGEAEAGGDVVVFHAGTREEAGRLVTAGGRVLNVTGAGPDIESAIVRAYEAVGKIQFEGAHFRTDIGQKALKYRQNRA